VLQDGRGEGSAHSRTSVNNRTQLRRKNERKESQQAHAAQHYTAKLGNVTSYVIDITPFSGFFYMNTYILASSGCYKTKVLNIYRFF
jgi:hypothetical protein